MFSLRETLSDLEALPPETQTYADEVLEGYQPDPRSMFPHGHLPRAFDPTKGIRMLFPAGEARVSWLDRYRFIVTGSKSLSSSSATFQFLADGGGNWLLYVNLSSNAIRNAVGFVFLYSTDSTGHGITAQLDGGAEASVIPVTNIGDMSWVASGVYDSWIAGNWVRLFDAGVSFYLSDATGYNTLPPATNVATDAGFSGMTYLSDAWPNDASWNPGNNAGSWDALWGPYDGP